MSTDVDWKLPFARHPTIEINQKNH